MLENNPLYDATPPAPPARPRRTGVKLGFFALLLAAALVIAFVVVQHRRAAAESSLDSESASSAAIPAQVNFVHPTFGASTRTLTLPASARGWYQSTIYARVSGYVDHWYADIGDRVKKGQLLATIDTPDLDAQFDAAQHQFLVAQSEVTVAKANADFAKKQYDRWRDAGPGVAAVQETEEKQAASQSGVAQLQAAQSKADAAKADVDRLGALKEFKRVTAPYDGVITTRNIDIGDLITAGSTASTSPIYGMAQVDQIRVFVDVPQLAAVAMTVGTPAVGVANEVPEHPFRGTIARTSNAIDSSAKTLHVEVDMPNPDGLLLPGMYLQLTFQLKQGALLQIPASALLFHTSGPQVAVIGDDNKVAFHDVTIAHDQGDVVQIGSGLSSTDRIALNISDQIAAGDKVNPVDNSQPAPAVSTAVAPEH
jgi:RND family efflux transporter MFP subunit